MSDVNEEVWKGMEMVIRCGERKAKIGIRIENVRGHLWSLTGSLRWKIVREVKGGNPT